jgi:hypothetical protein
MAEEKDVVLCILGIDFNKLVFQNYPKALKSNLKKANIICIKNNKYLFFIFIKKIKITF